MAFPELGEYLLAQDNTGVVVDALAALFAHDIAFRDEATFRILIDDQICHPLSFKRHHLAEVLFRDAREVQPPKPADGKDVGNIYKNVEPAQFIACQEDIWQPLPEVAAEDGSMMIKVRGRSEHRARGRGRYCSRQW